ncbi:MAG: hypothetical protein ACMG6S_12545 [Byssovorax sp.]
MTKRAVGGMLMGLLVSVTAAIASCSFPTYDIVVTGTAGSAGGASATSSSGSGGGGASSTGTTSSGSSGTGCVGGDCDCDGDKVLAISCGTGTDCNDNDPLVFKGQTKFFQDKIAGSINDYDYDCSGKEEYEIKTALACGTGAICDTTTVGWKTSVPPCGVSAQFGTCKAGVLTCMESLQGSQPQKCH